jgi:ABC-type amino acid transport substrate-binding protein
VKHYLFLILVLVAMATGVLRLESQDVVPTLVPPTLVPTPVRGVADTVPGESGVARILRDGRVRVGVLFNEPPFGELTIRGEVRGFDADLARLLAETWGVELELVQVRRQNSIEAVEQGRVDLLLAAQVRNRELDARVEFSQPYRISQQAMMVRNDDPAETLFNMTNRTIGYVLGTEGQVALQAWQSETGLALPTREYLTLDRAISALFAGEVDGVVARSEQLLRVAGDQVFSARILEEPVAVEPFAIAMMRQDAPLRNLVNRTLQYLLAQNRIAPLYNTYFQGQSFAMDTLPVYGALGDEAPRPQQFASDIRFPLQYVVPAILQNRVVRVAGLFEPQEGASEGERRLYEFNRQLVELIAQRWGVQVQAVEGGDVFELLELGLADLAVGVGLDWSIANRVDLSQPYLFHGDRLMVRTNSQVSGFNDLRGRWIGIMHTDTGAQERAQAWAASINAQVRFYSTFEQDAAKAMLEDRNADVIYGDSLKLLQHLAAYPNDLRLTDRWYSRRYVGIAVPLNDIDARLLIDYTLQELDRDGSLDTLWQLVYPPASELPRFLFVPGPGDYYGLNLRR